MLKQVSKKKRYNNVILIPTDFSGVCENAILHGIELAQFLHYSVCVLHVTSPAKEDDERTTIKMLEQIKVKFRKFMEGFEKKFNVKFDLLVKEGNILKVINQTAKEIRANLMILGTPGKQGLQHLFGSHALRVILDSTCPVIVVQNRSFGEGFRDIVLPVSSDIEPGQAIDWVIQMNRLFRSKIRLFQSFETDTALNTKLKAITSRFIKILEENYISYEVESAGYPEDYSSQIISYARAHHSDLIMIMTMPREEIPGFNFSAWNEQLMFNEARIPVMCFNPADQNNQF